MKTSLEKKPHKRPDKYGTPLEQHHFSSHIPEGFKNIFSVLKDLSKIDNNDNFKEYCSEIEKITDINKLGESRLSIYIRWVLAKHCLNNMHLLPKAP